MGRSLVRADEQKLVEKARNGDMHAFKSLIQKYEQQIASTVIGMVGEGPEAQDIGQETFIRFYKNLHTFRGQASVGTYLTRIAINLCLNELKRRKRNQKRYMGTTEAMNEVTDPLNSHEQKDHREWLLKALNALDAKYKSVVVLRLVEGYSTKETARILKLPQGTILSRLSRGVEKLKQLLNELERPEIHS
jgi:RNA polymerase sigma-70 factor (ECF subfamily)